MDVMDPFTYDLLASPPPPALFGAFSGDAVAAALQTEESTELVDAYLRAIGVLPALPPADFPPTPMYSTPLALKASVVLPPSRETYDAAVDAHVVQPAIEVPPRLPGRTAPVSDGATNKNSATRPHLCTPYDADIDANLRATEKDAKERPSPDYMKTVQGDRMSPLTRASLVLWMDTFTRHYGLAAGTLHRAVSYIDRVLSVRVLANHSDHQLHLLGAAAVFTAGKYEEQRTRGKLNADDIAWYVGFTTRQEVLAMESAMVEALGYRLGGPTAYTFVEHFTRYSDGEQDLQVQRMAHQLAEQSLIDNRCVKLLPSAVAAAAIFLARLTLNPPASLVQKWNRDLKELTGYKPMDLIIGVYSMYMLIHDPRFMILPVFFEDP